MKKARLAEVMRSLLITTAFTALALGCTANEPGPNAPDDGTQGANVPTTTAENKEAGYSVALPQGSSTTPTEKAPGQFEYTTPNGTVLITVKTGDRAAFDAAKAAYTTKANSFGGATKGTDTQFSSAWREVATGPRSSATLLLATGKLYECTVTSSNAPTLMVCQSLKAL